MTKTKATQLALKPRPTLLAYHAISHPRPLSLATRDTVLERIPIALEDPLGGLLSSHLPPLTFWPPTKLYGEKGTLISKICVWTDRWKDIPMH